MSTVLESYEAAKHAASARLDEELKRRWPKGSPVRVMLQHGQRRPSVGTVIGHGDGRLTVQLSTVNRRGKHTLKHVHWKRVLS